MKGNANKATAVIPARHVEAKPHKVHRRCQVLSIPKGATLRGMPQPAFDRLVRMVGLTLEGMRGGSSAAPPGGHAAGSLHARAMDSGDCWEIGRYFETIEGEPHLCIIYECRDGAQLEECHPI